MKKLASLLLALVMILSCTFAMAEETTTPKYTITVPNNGHTYEVFQIFTGDLHEHVLSNIVWGIHGKEEAGTEVDDAILEELETAGKAENATNTTKLAVILKYVDFTEAAIATLDEDNLSVKVDPGYYLLRDKTGTVPDKDTYTTYVVEIVEDVNISPKHDTVTSEKKVKDANDTQGTVTDWQDSADHDVNDVIDFKLTGTLPDNYDDYEKFYYVFHDTQSLGLTFMPETVVVKAGNTTLTKGTDYTLVEDPTDGCTFEIVFPNMKNINSITKDSVITVEYKSTLNENAVIGSAGNPNTMNVEFSNNPNETWNGETKPETGETPEDKVIVFTYKVVVNKVHENPAYDANKDSDNDGTDDAGNQKYLPLEKAGFTLKKYNKETEAYEDIGEELKGDALTTFEWKGLDDGDYKLVETTTPAGYNTIADIEFTITAEHEVLSNDPRLTALDGGDLATGDVDTGAITADVENKSGSTLPETGGMGTTLLYVGGGILVLAAIVMLIAKRRVNAD